MFLIIAAALASSQAEAKPIRCDIRIGELVPTAQVAKEIAEAVIRNRQTVEQTAKYRLNVERDRDDPRMWIVVQSIPESSADADGNIQVTMGGGGLGMRIDRCNGRINKVHYQR